MIGYTLSWIIAVMLVVVGCAAGLAPGLTARGFGITATDPAALAYVRASGSRDLVLALILIMLLVHHATVFLALSIALSAFIAATDLVLVMRTPGAQRSSGLVHGSSVVVLLVTAACLASLR
ncbi:MAG TPA: DUF4267 domain-containing protein [Gemmatimonadaceae bacterium]|nr:DUF4267 domain-containing protein [Gemmatimonadaceae bacterium]